MGANTYSHHCIKFIQKSLSKQASLC